MYVLSKILPLFFMPWSVAFLLLLFGFWRVHRGFRSGRLFFGIGLVWLYVHSIPFSTGLAVSWWEGEPSRLVVEPLNHASAAVVLGGFIHSRVDDSEQFFVRDAVDRLLDGIRVFRAGKVDFLALSAGQFPGERGRPEAALMRSFIREFSSLPDSVILVESRSINTEQNAFYSAELFDSLALEPHIILVTSAAHMPRARFLFECAGFEVQGVPTDFSQYREFWLSFPLNLIPSVDHLQEISSIYREVMGWAYYRLVLSGACK